MAAPAVERDSGIQSPEKKKKTGWRKGHAVTGLELRQNRVDYWAKKAREKAKEKRDALQAKELEEEVTGEVVDAEGQEVPQPEAVQPLPDAEEQVPKLTDADYLAVANDAPSVPRKMSRWASRLTARLGGGKHPKEVQDAVRYLEKTATMTVNTFILKKNFKSHEDFLAEVERLKEEGYFMASYYDEEYLHDEENTGVNVEKKVPLKVNKKGRKTVDSFAERFPNPTYTLHALRMVGYDIGAYSLSDKKEAPALERLMEMASGNEPLLSKVGELTTWGSFTLGSQWGEEDESGPRLDFGSLQQLADLEPMEPFESLVEQLNVSPNIFDAPEIVVALRSGKWEDGIKAIGREKSSRGAKVSIGNIRAWNVIEEKGGAQYISNLEEAGITIEYASSYIFDNASQQMRKERSKEGDQEVSRLLELLHRDVGDRLNSPEAIEALATVHTLTGARSSINQLFLLDPILQAPDDAIAYLGVLAEIDENAVRKVHPSDLAKRLEKKDEFRSLLDPEYISFITYLKSELKFTVDESNALAGYRSHDGDAMYYELFSNTTLRNALMQESTRTLVDYCREASIKIDTTFNDTDIRTVVEIASIPHCLETLPMLIPLGYSFGAISEMQNIKEWIRAMSKDEVRTRLGDPDVIIANDHLRKMNLTETTQEDARGGARQFIPKAIRLQNTEGAMDLLNNKEVRDRIVRLRTLATSGSARLFIGGKVEKFLEVEESDIAAAEQFFAQAEEYSVDIEDLLAYVRSPEAIAVGKQRLVEVAEAVPTGTRERHLAALGSAEQWEEIKELLSRYFTTNRPPTAEAIMQISANPDGFKDLVEFCRVNRIIKYSNPGFIAVAARFIDYSGTIKKIHQATAGIKHFDWLGFDSLDTEKLARVAEMGDAQFNEAIPHCAGSYTTINQVIESIIAYDNNHDRIEGALPLLEERIGPDWKIPRDMEDLALLAGENGGKILDTLAVISDRFEGVYFSLNDIKTVHRMLEVHADELVLAAAEHDFDFSYQYADQVIAFAKKDKDGQLFDIFVDLHERYGVTAWGAMFNPELLARFSRSAEVQSAMSKIDAAGVKIAVHLTDIDRWEEAAKYPDALDMALRLTSYLDYSGVLPADVPLFQPYVGEPEFESFIGELNEQGGFTLRVSELDVVHGLMDQREAILQDLKDLKELYPDYRYRFQGDWKQGPDGNAVQEKITDPYDTFVGSGGDMSGRLEWMHSKMGIGVELPERLSEAIMKSLRRHDTALNTSPELQRNIDPEQVPVFHDGLNRFITAVFDKKGTLEQDRDIFGDVSCLRYLARHPERTDEVIGFKETAPRLFELLSSGGPLYSNRQQVMRDIFSNGDFLGRAQQVESIFTKKMPYWKQLIFYTETRLGELLKESTSGVHVGEIGNQSIDDLRARHHRQKETSPDKQSRLESLIGHEQMCLRIINGQDYAKVPFSALSGTAKRMVYRDRIRDTVGRSRDPEFKQAADERNRANAPADLRFTRSMGAHGTNIHVLRDILLSGNLPRESLGEESKTDAFPFHFDFWNVDPHADNELDRIASPNELLQKTNLSNYSSADTGVVLFYDRSREDAYQRSAEIPGGVQGKFHRVLLGGMPSSEISSIAVRNPEKLENAVLAIIEHGAYIPIYDMDGSLLFTADEYDRRREDNNFKVPVDVWDSSMRTGQQLGSNPGGEFTVPTAEGPVPHYVKFAAHENPDRIWNEQLADNLYRRLGIPVPETSVVRVVGNYGHASRIMELDAESRFADLKDGFIADCWQANWDTVFDRNVATSGGKLQRLDNGGALLYRAQGERRTNFSGVVTELESQKNKYTGLTSEDISRQVAELRDRMTDEAIDEEVDNVRLPAADRTELKRVLRERRDYIIAYYNEEEVAVEPIPEAAESILALWRSDTFDNAAMAQVVTQWEKLNGKEGYQHDGVLLGEHLKDAGRLLRESAEYKELQVREQALADIAILFHDIGKPTGFKGEVVERDYGHEVPSAQIAAEYMRQWGMSTADIRTVLQVITYDGIVSDIARGKVHDQRDNVTPEALLAQLGNNKAAARILRAVNRADTVAVVGEQRFSAIAERFNEFFAEMVK